MMWGCRNGSPKIRRQPHFCQIRVSGKDDASMLTCGRAPEDEAFLVGHCQTQQSQERLRLRAHTNYRATVQRLETRNASLWRSSIELKPSNWDAVMEGFSRDGSNPSGCFD